MMIIETSKKTDKIVLAKASMIELASVKRETISLFFLWQRKTSASENMFDIRQNNIN